MRSRLYTHFAIASSSVLSRELAITFFGWVVVHRAPNQYFDQPLTFLSMFETRTHVGLGRSFSCVLISAWNVMPVEEDIQEISNLPLQSNLGFLKILLLLAYLLR